MHHLSKYVGIFIVLSLLALALGGCTEGAMSLVLKVDMPKDGATVNTPAVAVTGSLAGREPEGAKVSINGADVPVKENKFSTDITLNEGKNVITVEATNGMAKLNQQVTVTYVPAKK